jgi:glycerol-3-phosphate dehydrogenase
MSHPEDGRVAFVIPRPDYGAGVVIVGTTDGPTPLEPEKAVIEPTDIEYLMDLLKRYFPKLNISTADILSAYIGVRPLMGTQSSTAGSEGQPSPKIIEDELHKVSREHYIGRGPGGTVLAAGGKYTTHRLMAREIVDFALKQWRIDAGRGEAERPPNRIGPSRTESPVNPMATREAVEASRKEAGGRGWEVPEPLWNRYGAEALEIMKIQTPSSMKDPEGFPFLEAQLRYLIRNGMVLHLEDFYLRRIPLFATRKDHGLPWAEPLARIWAEERGLSESAAAEEAQRLKEELACRDAWKASLSAATSHKTARTEDPDR